MSFLASGTIPRSATSQASITFFKEVHAFLQNHAQVPSIRTQYCRTAFQHSDSNAVRISVDENVCMFAERDPAEGEQSQIQDILIGTRHWHEQHVPFEYCIVEVKLSEDESVPWIDELQAAGLLVPAPK